MFSRPAQRQKVSAKFSIAAPISRISGYEELFKAAAAPQHLAGRRKEAAHLAAVGEAMDKTAELLFVIAPAAVLRYSAG